MQASDLKDALAWTEPSVPNLFTCLNTVSKYVMEHGPQDKAALDAIIRLRDLAEQKVITNAALKDAVMSLCREAGLFPYLPEQELNWRDQVAYELFRAPSEMDYVFHREQWQTYQLLLSGKSIVLSAPTSFGKSVLILAFIAQKKPDCVVVIVPTLALLDQFRRRLSAYFGAEYTIITRNDQTVPPERKRIFVLTQERLLERDDIDQIDLLAIDEYYKLDTGRERQGDSGRAALLNVALRRYLDSAKQIFFLGPTVAGVEMRPELRGKFLEVSSEFTTVAVDIHDHTDARDLYDELVGLIRKYGADKSLIFSKSPPAARRLTTHLQTRVRLPISEELRGMCDWLAENYHPEWPVVSALRAGFGLHHGSVPRSIAQALVRQFNEGELGALICTSTLIEGVNTAAKNVFIFDKKINNSDFDYFDFRNIAGRSGRMGHHFVGRIFLFHEPPAHSAFQLEIPALGSEERLPDAVLINLPDDTLTDQSRFRKQEIIARSSLPPELVKPLAQYGLIGVEALSSAIRGALQANEADFVWRGYGGYPELFAVFNICWRHLKFNKGRLSAGEAAFHANRLRGSETLRGYFDGLVLGKEGEDRIEAIEKGFRALLAFDYAIPKLLIDLEALVNFHCADLGREPVEYSFMAQQLDNLFSHHWVKALDEYGVPIPLGRKLSFLVEDESTLEDAIAVMKAFCESPRAAGTLTEIERQLITAALA